MFDIDINIKFTDYVEYKELEEIAKSKGLTLEKYVYLAIIKELGIDSKEKIKDFIENKKYSVEENTKQRLINNQKEIVNSSIDLIRALRRVGVSTRNVILIKENAKAKIKELEYAPYHKLKILTGK